MPAVKSAIKPSTKPAAARTGTLSTGGLATLNKIAAALDASLKGKKAGDKIDRKAVCAHIAKSTGFENNAELANLVGFFFRNTALNVEVTKGVNGGTFLR